MNDTKSISQGLRLFVHEMLSHEPDDPYVLSASEKLKEWAADDDLTQAKLDEHIASTKDFNLREKLFYLSKIFQRSEFH